MWKINVLIISFIKGIIRDYHIYMENTVNYQWNKFICVIIDLIFKKLNVSLHGGKISEKANAIGNAIDTGRNYRMVSQTVLNSPSLSMSRIRFIRHYSTLKEELPAKGVKRAIIENGFKKWPNNEQINVIYKVVHKQQMALVEMANVYGLNSKVLRDPLCGSREFT